MDSDVRVSRKDFLALLGAGTFLLPGILRAGTGTAKLGFQLYTVRHQIEKDFGKTIGTVAAMGFMGVETYPLPESVSVERAARTIRDAGLTVSGMHTDLPVGRERDRIPAMADAYQCRNVIYPGWPAGLSAGDPHLLQRVKEVFRDMDETRRRVDLYNDIGAFFRGKGLRFGLHNHWWEFETQNGIIPFYYLRDHLDSDIFFEIDTYWAKTAGRDPAAVVHDFGSRAPFLHIKDGPATQDEQMFAHVPAGSGTLDFPAIAKAGGNNTEWMIAEFDEYAGDIFAGLQASYSYLTQHGLVHGNR